jgi:hypothetical protein
MPSKSMSVGECQCVYVCLLNVVHMCDAHVCGVKMRDLFFHIIIIIAFTNVCCLLSKKKLYSDVWTKLSIKYNSFIKANYPSLQ